MDRHRRETATRDIVGICHQGLDVNALFAAAGERVTDVVPVDRHCWHVLDPGSLMVTSNYGVNIVPEARLGRYEYEIPDVNKWSFLARHRRPSGLIREATGGHPERSPRFRDVIAPRGDVDELRLTLVSDGDGWGSAALIRSEGSALFTADEADFVASVGPHLADGVRRSLLLQEAMGSPRPSGPGLILLDDRLEPEVMNDAARDMIEDLVEDLGPRTAGWMPQQVTSVAAAARRAERHGDIARASIRTRTRSGRWLLIHGSGLGDRLAVVLEPARPADLAPLIMRAYGLTPREREVTGLVLRGLATQQIARRLRLSPYTVQDHLKSVFDKVGVRSRGELAGRIFYEQYWPRLAEGAPLGSDGFFAEPVGRGGSPDEGLGDELDFAGRAGA